MNSDEIKKAKLKYEELLQKREELKNIKQEYEELLSNPSVIRYRELRDEKDKKILSDEEIIHYAFSESERSNCNIYVYMGAFKYDNTYDARDDFKIEEEEYADYFLYQNLEDEFDSYLIEPENKEEFELKKIIIIKFSQYYEQRSEYYYYRLQEKYFKHLLADDNQEEIVKSLIKKY